MFGGCPSQQGCCCHLTCHRWLAVPLTGLEGLSNAQNIHINGYWHFYQQTVTRIPTRKPLIICWSRSPFQATFPATFQSSKSSRKQRASQRYSLQQHYDAYCMRTSSLLGGTSSLMRSRLIANGSSNRGDAEPKLEQINCIDVSACYAAACWLVCHVRCS